MGMEPGVVINISGCGWVCVPGSQLGLGSVAGHLPEGSGIEIEI